jgi:hypothetical protein
LRDVFDATGSRFVKLGDEQDLWPGAYYAILRPQIIIALAIAIWRRHHVRVTENEFV